MTAVGGDRKTQNGAVLRDHLTKPLGAVVLKDSAGVLPRYGMVFTQRRHQPVVDRA